MKDLSTKTSFLCFLLSLVFLTNPAVLKAGGLPVDIKIDADNLLKYFTDFVVWVMERKDSQRAQEIKDSIPQLMVGFSRLAGTKDNLANDLEIYADMLRVYPDNEDSKRALHTQRRQIELYIRGVDSALRDINRMLKIIDPEWVRNHGSEINQTFEVFAEKEALMLRVKNEVVDLTHPQAKDLALVFREEAVKLRELVKTLGESS